jgi:hypothetical protein
MSRRWSAGIRPEDDTAVAAVLAWEHPTYASHMRTPMPDLAEEVSRHPPGRR